VSEVIICPLWEPNNKRFRRRRYHAWDRRCTNCDRTVAVSDAAKRRLDAEANTQILCEHCALVLVPDVEMAPASEPERNAVKNEEACPTCSVFKAETEAAAKERARLEGMPDRVAAAAAKKKWEHLFRAQWAHKFKAHNADRRGKV